MLRGLRASKTILILIVFDYICILCLYILCNNKISNVIVGLTLADVCSAENVSLTNASLAVFNQHKNKRSSTQLNIWNISHLQVNKKFAEAFSAKDASLMDAALREFTLTLEKANITYFMVAGTLLDHTDTIAEFRGMMKSTWQ